MPEARAGHRNGRVNPPPRPTHRHGNEVMDAASSALALQTPPPIEIAMATECEGRPLRRHQLRRPELTACPPTSTRSRSRSAILARTGRTSAYARLVTRAALTREGSRARCGRRSDRSPGGARRGSSHPRRGHARLRRANAASRVLARPGSIDRAPEPSGKNTSRTRMVQVRVPVRVGDGRVRRGSVRSVRGVGRSSPPDARGVPPARANVR